MKKYIIIVSVILSITLQSCDTVVQVATGIAETAGAAWMAGEYDKYGYSKEEGIAATKFLADGLGFNSSNVNKGINWVNAADDNIRKNIVANDVYDLAGKITGEQDLMNTFKQVTSAELNYKSDMAHATTDEERQAAFDRRTQNYADISYDAYQTAKERKTAYLAQQSQIANELKSQGYSSQEAMDIASSLIAVENADYMNEEEKQEYYDLFFKSGATASARTEVKNVASGNYSENTAQNQSASTSSSNSVAEKPEQDKAKIDKENAVNTVRGAKINSYTINSTELTEEQKATLDKIAVTLNQYPDLTIQIKGHTCDLGSDEVNNRIGLRRAENAKKYLTNKGISANRITAISGGEKDPLVANSSEENRRQNRRLTFEVK